MSEIDERPRIGFAFPEIGRALFIRVCETCGRFVTPDALMALTLIRHEDLDPWYEPRTPNATCRRCGRTAMIWEGYE